MLDLLSAIVPYTTASIPAYLTYTHTIDYMEFPVNIAILAAFTVEVLGVTAVSTAIRFWQWNSNHKSNAERAPFMLAVFTYMFYIVITLSVNVILEVYADVRSPAVIWAIALFSLLSIPSGVLISIRAQFGEMLEDKREKAEQRRQNRAQRPSLRPVQSAQYSAESQFNFPRKHAQKILKVCACGCGESFYGRADKLYVNNAHRMRALRAKETAHA